MHWGRSHAHSDLEGLDLEGLDQVGQALRGPAVYLLYEGRVHLLKLAALVQHEEECPTIPAPLHWLHI
ncbi:unnamed protein product, partial [Sphagnum compactum]